MEAYKTINGIILSQIKYKEFDKIFTILTEELGKITCIAKGIVKTKSKMRAFFQTGAILEVELIRKNDNIPLIKGVKSIFIPQIKNYDHLVYFERALELTNKLCQHEHVMKASVELLHNFIVLFESSKNKRVFFISYELQLLTRLGFLGDFKLCTKCNTKLSEKAHFFDGVHGFICDKCKKEDLATLVSFNEIKVISFLQNTPMQNINALSLDLSIIKNIETKAKILRSQVFAFPLKSEN